MRDRLTSVERRILPRGWFDVLRQLSMFVIAYLGYEAVRGLFGFTRYKPFGDATRIIDIERTLHVFVEPSIQAWAESTHWVMVITDWTYLNAHFFVTVGALAFIYLRRNDSFYFVRNTFMIAMTLALVGYALYPTAPPRLMPQWGFTDAIQQFTGVTMENGPGSAALNAYAAVPSMHVCFALMVGIPMAMLVRRRVFKVLWCMYPLFISFVVVVTGNHYLTDVVLGALTAGVAALIAKLLLARARPDVWAFSGVTA
jgi:membrane-associated phospholipid phosphatase